MTQRSIIYEIDRSWENSVPLIMVPSYVYALYKISYPKIQHDKDTIPHLFVSDEAVIWRTFRIH